MRIKRKGSCGGCCCGCRIAGLTGGRSVVVVVRLYRWVDSQGNLHRRIRDLVGRLFIVVVDLSQDVAHHDALSIGRVEDGLPHQQTEQLGEHGVVLPHIFSCQCNQVYIRARRDETRHVDVNGWLGCVCMSRVCVCFVRWESVLLACSCLSCARRSLGYPYAVRCPSAIRPPRSSRCQVCLDGVTDKIRVEL